MATADPANNDSPSVPSQAKADPRALPADSPSAGHRFSGTILNFGFVFALILAAVCLGSSIVYLYTFLSTTMTKIDGLLVRAGTPGVTEVLIQLGINAALVSARLALLSCGVFIAMAFGFLGFGLFLIGVKGDIEASGTGESFGFKVARMSPGVFVMTATMVLVGVCVTHRTPFDYHMEQSPPSPASGERAAESILKRLQQSSPPNTATHPVPIGLNPAVSPAPVPSLNLNPTPSLNPTPTLTLPKPVVTAPIPTPSALTPTSSGPIPAAPQR